MDKLRLLLRLFHEKNNWLYCKKICLQNNKKLELSMSSILYKTILDVRARNTARLGFTK